LQIEKNVKINPELLHELKYNTIEEAGLDMLYLTAKAKLSEYREEESSYERKYGMSFAEFTSMVETKLNQESFEEEDDLMAWRFAHENAQYWKEKVQELEHCF